MSEELKVTAVFGECVYHSGSVASRKVEFFTDLEGTIPAKEGEPIALAKNIGMENGVPFDMMQPDPKHRPILVKDKDGNLGAYCGRVKE